MRRALTLASAAIAPALAVVALLAADGTPRPPRGTEHPAATTAARATVIGRGAGPDRRLTPPKRAAADEDLRAGARPRLPGRSAGEAGAAARRFLVALLAFEQTGASESVRRALRETAPPALRRFMLDRPPRRPAGVPAPPRGRLVALEPLPGTSQTRLEYGVTIRRGPRETGLIVILRRVHRWWVTALR